MPYVRKRNPRRRAARRPTKSRKNFRKPTTGMVKKMVKQEIARQAENKTIQHYVPVRSIVPCISGNLVSTIIPLAPAPTYLEIGLGAGSGSRVGNKITIKNATIKGTIYPAVYNATTNPVLTPTHVCFWLFYDREAPNSVPNPIGDFFQLGNTYSVMNNNLTDLWAPVNNDRYRLFSKRMFKIGSSDTNGASGGNPLYRNNDFALSRNFSINYTKYLVKTTKFADTNNLPTTRGLYLMATAINASGSANYASNIVPCQMAFNMSMTYEDI